MKIFLKSLFLFLTSVTLISCGGGDDDPIINPDKPNQGGTEITLQEKQMLGVVAEGNESSVAFEAPENWRVKNSASWISCSPERGTKGTSKVTVKVAENTSTDERGPVEVIIETVSDSKAFYKLTISQKGREAVNNPDENQNAPAGMKKNAQALVNQIKVGWNLGNTCESGIWDGYNKDVDAEGETAWGNPKTTKAMFSALKDAGFNAIRIPVRWYLHADDAMNIREAWMNRVKEIVDYAVSQDMYVILNSHHDNWYDRLPVGYDETAIRTKFQTMWTQIANAFKDYDEHLIFAGVNEIIKLKADGSEDWGSPNATNIKFGNELMQLFVNTVRETGGKNKWRCLMVQPWAASPNNALNNSYALPEDKTPNRLIQEFHCYDPYNYAIGKDQKGNQWAQHELKQSDYTDLSNLFAKMKTNFIDKGVPVIMAEFGSTQDNSYSKGNEAADQIRADYHKFIVSEAKKNGFPGFYWDNGAFTGNGENFGLLDRKTCNFPNRAQIALDGIMAGLK